MVEKCKMKESKVEGSRVKWSHDRVIQCEVH